MLAPQECPVALVTTLPDIMGQAVNFKGEMGSGPT
jgi:hypothetical protein